jgi:ribonuclease PH
VIRPDGRRYDELRPVRLTRGFLAFAEGSCLIEVGRTKVVCTASVEDKVPPFLRGSGQGWITAEYGMLPRATETRTVREVTKGRPQGRTQEIQRLIGRALRVVCDLSVLGERTIWIDCDVLQADGGTRTAAITGAFVALVDAARWLRREGRVTGPLLRGYLAATSVGVVEGQPLLDLTYAEDCRAEVDLNIVRTGDGQWVEIQGAAEAKPFSDERLEELLRLGRAGVAELIAKVRAELGPDAEEVGL